MAGEYIEFDNNNQPAVNDTNLNRLQQLIKQDIVGTVGGDTLPIGTIVQFGSTTIPTNWLACDGSEVSRTTYQDLFNTIGTTYGQGDGFSTFNLPDLSAASITYIIKATQSAGIVAEVINNLNSTSSTDALSANQGNVLKGLLDGTTLYENSSGTNSTISLSQNPLSFKRLEIDYVTDDGSHSVTYRKQDIPIYGTTTQVHNLTSNYFGSSYMYTFDAFISINTNNIVFNTNRIYQQSVNNPSVLTRTETPSIKITKIVGYNY